MTKEKILIKKSSKKKPKQKSSLKKNYLTSQSELSQLFFKNSKVGLNLCRIDGTWVESNPAFFDLIGYSNTEANGKLTYWQLTPRKYDETEKLQLENLSKFGHYGPYEKEFIRKDGSLVPVRLNGFIVEYNGEKFIWSTIEDLTEIRKLEEQVKKEHLKLIQSSKLASLGEMSAGIAHEVNNPLAIISGSIQLLERSINDPTKFASRIQAIARATERISKIVSGLKKFSKQDQSTDFNYGSLSSIIQDSLVKLETKAKLHNTRVSFDVRSHSRLLCDEVGIEQVLVNLLNNAFDAVKDLDDRWVKVAVFEESESLVLQVQDSGPGISEEIEQKIFQPFFTTKPIGEGPGLGLAISKGILDRHKATIRLNRSEQNTCFEIRFPISQRNQKTA